MRNSVTSRPVVAAFMFALLAAQTDAMAAGCQGKPNALGTGRVIAVDPAEHGRIGTMQYAETLPLRDHEVVLTFDDGPLPPRTNRVLDILAAVGHFGKRPPRPAYAVPAAPICRFSRTVRLPIR